MQNKYTVSVLLIAILAISKQTLLANEIIDISESEDIFYQTYNWEFVDEKVVGKIEQESHRGFGLFILKWLATIPSLCFTTAGLEYTYKFLLKGEENGKKLGETALHTAIGLSGGAFLLLLRWTVGKVGQNYKTRKARNKVFLEIANNIDKYKKYLPEDLIPLFEKIKISPEDKVREISERIAEKIREQSHDQLAHKYTFCRALRVGLCKMFRWAIGKSVFCVEYVVLLAALLIVKNSSAA